MFRRLFLDLAKKTGIYRRFNKQLRKLNYIRRVRVNGVQIRVPVIRGIACNITEPWMTGVLAVLMKEQPGTFLDVGVNVGQTLVKAKAIEPQRNYVGFEPNPSCNFYTQELIRHNNFQKCTILPFGLFCEDKVLALDLYTYDPADSAGSVIENFRPDTKIQHRIFVPVFKYESIAQFVGSDPVGIIKIDVEGAEYEVMQGLLDLIRRDKPLIVVEILPVYSETHTGSIARQDRLQQLIADLGYSLYRIAKTGDDLYSGLRHIRKIEVHSDLALCDYVLIPDERLESLRAAQPGSFEAEPRVASAVGV